MCINGSVLCTYERPYGLDIGSAANVLIAHSTNERKRRIRSTILPYQIGYINTVHWPTGNPAALSLISLIA